MILLKCRKDSEIFYTIYHYPASKAGRPYANLEKLLEKGFIPGSHAILAVHELDFLEIPNDEAVTSDRLVPSDVVKESLSEPVTLKPGERATAEVTQIIRSTSFRDLVLFFYEHKCAITGVVIRHKGFMNLEAAHIHAQYAGGGDNPANGLALSRDLHWAFDKGMFTITPDFKVKVHPDLDRTNPLWQHDGHVLAVPQDARARPNQECLRWHHENAFGIFRQSV